MQGKTVIERIWAGCDALLLVAVFVLLGVVWYVNNQESAESGKAAPVRRATMTRWRSPQPGTDRTVEGMLRVAHERGRVNTIARSMVDSGWDRGPTSPAMDMREDGKTCDVFFTLPRGIDEDSVRVTAAGGVLTLTMKDDDSGKIYLQRIRIPYGVDRPDTIQTVISNDVLRVRISPAGG